MKGDALDEIELRYERMDQEGHLEFVDRLWSRTIWTLAEFSDQLKKAGFAIIDTEKMMMKSFR